MCRGQQDESRVRIAETTAAKAPSPEAFFSDHVQASVPLVVRGAAAQ